MKFQDLPPYREPLAAPEGSERLRLDYGKTGVEIEDNSAGVGRPYFRFCAHRCLIIIESRLRAAAGHGAGPDRSSPNFFCSC
jgi:hypothetical protein